MNARVALPPLTSLADLLDLIVTRLPCDDAPAGYKPPDGWHTISVGNASTTHAQPFADALDSVDLGALCTWMRLFDLYAANRRGTLYWRDVPHIDREKREITATFCIDGRKSK